MKRLLNIFQEGLKLFLFFFIAYIWLAYSISSRTFALIFSTSIALLLEILSLIISKKHKKKKTIKQSQENDAENMFISLVSKNDPIDFYFNLFKTRHKNVIRREDYLLIQEQNQTILFYPFLKIKTLSVDDLIAITKKDNTVSKIIITCNDFDKECAAFCEDLKIEATILNKYESYSMLYEEYDFYPEITKQALKTKSSLRLIIQKIFDKQRTKNYLISGVFLFLFSLYVPYSLYYKITASILFLFACVCLLKNKPITKKELV